MTQRVSSRNQTSPPRRRELRLEWLESRRMLIGPNDDFGDTAAAASLLELDANGHANIAGVITQGDVDFFQLNVDRPGSLFVAYEAQEGSGLDTVLRLLDETATPIDENDDAGTGTNSRINIQVAGDETFFIEAAAFDGEGPYTLSVGFDDPPGGDDFGNDTATATLLEFDGSLAARQSGRIDPADDIDMFRVVVPQAGLLDIRHRATFVSDLDAFLRVLDDAGNELDQNDDSGETTNSRISLEVVAGQTLLVETSSFSDGGTYELTLNLESSVQDDAGNSIDEAVAIDTVFSDPVTRFGTIDFPGDVDVYRLVAGRSGLLTVRQQSTDGALDSVVRILDDRGATIVENDDQIPGQIVDSQAQTRVQTGDVLFIAADAFDTSTGAYNLSLDISDVNDDFGNDRASAHRVEFDENGDAEIAGRFEIQNDVDLFRIVAPADGLLTVMLDATPQSASETRDPRLTVLDAAGVQVAFDDDSGFELNSLIQRHVAPGETLFFQAGSFEGVQGGYSIRFELRDAPPDDFGNGVSSAAQITPGQPVSGDIEQAADTDVFRFVPTETEILSLRLTAAPGSTLDPQLRILDANGNLLSFNDDDGFGFNSHVQLAVQAGQTVFVEARSASSTRGRYLLSIDGGIDDFGDALDETVQTIPVDQERGQVSGTVNFPGDVDTFRAVAPSDARVTIRQSAVAPGNLDSLLTVLDESGGLIARNDDFAGGRDSQVRFDVAAGVEFFVSAAGFGSSVGAYDVDLTFVDQTDDEGDTFRDAEPLQLDQDGALSNALGNLFATDDVDVYEFVAPVRGEMTATVELTGGSAGMLVFNEDRVRIARAGEGSGQASFPVEAGESYFIRIAADADVGDYRLDLSTGAPLPPGPARIDDELGDDLLIRIRALLAAGQADQVNQLIVDRLREKLGDDQVQDVLVIWLDPVDFLVRDPGGDEAGFTANDGRVNELRGRGFYSGNGVVELLVVSGAEAGVYNLDLFGVGSDFQGGASFTDSRGTQTASFSGSLVKGNLDLALDFSRSQPVPNRSLAATSTDSGVQLASSAGPSGNSAIPVTTTSFVTATLASTVRTGGSDSRLLLVDNLLGIFEQAFGWLGDMFNEIEEEDERFRQLDEMLREAWPPLFDAGDDQRDADENGSGDEGEKSVDGESEDDRALLRLLSMWLAFAIPGADVVEGSATSDDTAGPPGAKNVAATKAEQAPAIRSQPNGLRDQARANQPHTDAQSVPVKTAGIQDGEAPNADVNRET